MRAQNKLEKGFTLIELLVVIAIIGILSAIAFLSVSDMRARYGAEKTIKGLYTDLMNTRVLAMSRNRTHFVVFTASQYIVYEDTSPADGNGTLETGADSKIRTFDVDPGFTIAYPAAWTGAGTFQFTGKGLVPAGIIPSGSDFIKVNTTAVPEYDCLSISQIRITLGKMNGAVCVGK